MTSTKALTKAIDTIAEFMTEMSTKEDRNTGEILDINLLGYAQRRVLNGIAYSAALTLQTTSQSYDEACQKVRLAARSHRGDELSELQLQRSIDWAQRLEMQMAHLQALVDAAADAHERHTGEKFVAPKARQFTERKFQSAALEQAKRFGIDTETNMAGGVEVAEQEAA